MITRIKTYLESQGINFNDYTLDSAQGSTSNQDLINKIIEEESKGDILIFFVNDDPTAMVITKDNPDWDNYINDTEVTELLDTFNHKVYITIDPS